MLREILIGCCAGEAWGVVKENVTAVLAPAKDVVVILDSITKYIPALMVAESIFAVCGIGICSV
jgi:hypothetical protein